MEKRKKKNEGLPSKKANSKKAKTVDSVESINESTLIEVEIGDIREGAVGADDNPDVVVLGSKGGVESSNTAKKFSGLNRDRPRTRSMRKVEGLQMAEVSGVKDKGKRRQREDRSASEVEASKKSKSLSGEFVTGTLDAGVTRKKGLVESSEKTKSVSGEAVTGALDADIIRKKGSVSAEAGTGGHEDPDIDAAEDDEDDCAVVEDDEDPEEETKDTGNEGQGYNLLEEVKDLPWDFGWEARNEEHENEATDGDSGDDAFDEDRIPDPLSSDDEEEPQQRETTDPEAELELGRTFPSAEEFKLTLLRYSMKTQYDIRYYTSSSLKLGAVCCRAKDEKYPCAWKVYCSYEPRKRKLMIKVLVKDHTCIRSGYSKLMKPAAIATLFSERLRLDPKLTKYEMADEIKRDFGFIVDPEACGKAKTKVTKERRRTHEDHFGRIWDYQAEILRSNPGSTMEIETIPGPSIGSKQRFYRLYMCFAAQRETWKKSCRPVIGVDGAFLKWDIKGQLLAAVGRDGDNRIVPIAWAVVEIENDSNWDWFVRLLSIDLGLNDGIGIAMLSDKQKAIHNILPKAEHRQCCRHIMDNWKKDSRDLQLQKLFWRIARSYHHGDFRFHMTELQKYSLSAYDSLQLTKPETWSRAFFKEGTCCNDILNNLCESFNRTIREARRKPLLDMLEDIRRQAMVRNGKREIISKRTKTRFTKRAHLEIEKMQRGSKYCNRFRAVGNLNEVDHAGVNYNVDMVEKSCGCRKWQLTGIPCIHASCVILSEKERIEDYVSEFYTVEKWRETYSAGIMPVQGERLWPSTNRLPVLPPPWRTGNRGRPSNHDRKKSANEVNSANSTKLSRAKRIMTCSNCKREGHNIKTCKNPFVESAPKRPQGRPRKDPLAGSAPFAEWQVPGSTEQVSQDLDYQGWDQGSQPASSQGAGTHSWDHGSQPASSQGPGTLGSSIGSQPESSGSGTQGRGWRRWFT